MRAQVSQFKGNKINDPTDLQWQTDATFKSWVAFMDKYYPSGAKTHNATVYGQSIAATTVQDAEAVRR